MKTENRTWKIGICMLVVFLCAHATFALEKAIGFDLGEKLHWSDGNPFNSHSLALSLDFSGEKFGIKPFFTFSFSVTYASNLSNNSVTYNYKDTTSVETFGIKPYYIFRKGESSNSYAGFLCALTFNQKERETTRVTTSAANSEANYITGELGLFVGNKWHASEKCTIFAECDLSSRLFSNSTTYKIGGKSVTNFQGGMLGGGGTSSWALYVTPRLGIAYRW